jgi:hypothetical protein
MSEEKKNNMNIELSEEIAQGKYSNLAVINHSNSEFVVDFVNIMPGMPKARVQSRIILTPEHAKRLFAALGENLRKFESMHGAIEEKNQPQVPFNFGGPTGEA